MPAVAQALTESVEEQRDALAGLAAREQFHVFLVASDTLADDAHQLLLEPGDLRGHVRQFVEWDFAHVGDIQRDGFTAMRAGAQCIEPDQFTGQVETNHLFLAVLADGDGLEGPFARDVDGAHRIANAEQPTAAFDGATFLDDGFQLFEVGGRDPRGQAQIPQ